MARYGLFVLKVPLNPNQPTNHYILAHPYLVNRPKYLKSTKV